MNDILDAVAPFHGNYETTVLKRPSGTPAAGWQWLKALPGNTHPGACWPFGVMSTCAYTGGYPTGYSPYQANSHGKPHILPRPHHALGMTHLQPSGIGGAGEYHNYLLVMPRLGQHSASRQAWPLQEERASPGWYAARFGDSVAVESTVTHHVAWHRVRFPSGVPGRLEVDLCFSYAGDERFVGTNVRRHVEDGNGRLHRPSHRDSAQIVAINGQTLSAIVRLDGRFTLYVVLMAHGPNGQWCVDTIGERPAKAGKTRCVTFFAAAPGPVELKLALSFRSIANAHTFLRQEMPHWDFNHRVEQTRSVWRNHLRRIEVDTPDHELRTIFYTSLYRCLLKPADFTNDSPLWVDRKTCWLDFATLWDQYKTLMPLIQLCWPDRGASMVNGLLNLTEYTGQLQNGYLIQPGLSKTFNAQGFGLAIPIVAHAAKMRLGGIHWERALRILSEAMAHNKPPQGKRGVDYAVAAFGLAQIAYCAGDKRAYEHWSQIAHHWRSQYRFPAGKVEPGPFYEGGAWNHSFTVWHDVEGLIEAHGGKANLLADLDCFFHLPGAVLRDIHCKTHHNHTLPVEQRFEGLNNEPDMEVPYLYTLLGRPDRTAQIVQCILKHRFTTGRGGLPGNDDSGGLSSWYVWSALGLFPMAGQGRALVSRSVFNEAVIHVGDRTIRIYPFLELHQQNPTFNGRPLCRPWLEPCQLKAGGELRVAPQKLKDA